MYFSFNTIFRISKVKKQFSEIVQRNKRNLFLALKSKKITTHYLEKDLKGEDYVFINKKDLQNINLLNKLLIRRIKDLELKLASFDHEDQIKNENSRDSLFQESSPQIENYKHSKDRTPYLVNLNSAPINKPTDLNLSYSKGLVTEPKILDEIPIKSETSLVFEQNILFKQVEHDAGKLRSIVAKFKRGGKVEGSVPEIVMLSRKMSAKSFYDHILVLTYYVLPSKFKDDLLPKMISLDMG